MFLLLDLGLFDCYGSELLVWLCVLFGCVMLLVVVVMVDVSFEIEGSGFCEFWFKLLNIDEVFVCVDVLIGSVLLWLL